MKSDEELYAEWQAARGTSPPVEPTVRPQIVAALRDRQRRIDSRETLTFCDKCGVRARGLHAEALG